MVSSQQTFVCTQDMNKNLGQFEPFQINYHESDNKDFYCLRTYSTSKTYDHVLTNIEQDNSDKMSSGLFAHTNSHEFKPNRAIQFYSSYADLQKQKVPKEEKKEF